MDLQNFVQETQKQLNSIERRLNDISAAGGQANTASNIGAGGVGLYQQKVGVDLQFRNINAASARVSVALDAGNNEVDIDVVEGSIDHGNIGGLADDDHTQYLLISGARAMSGNLDMGVQDIVECDSLGLLDSTNNFNRTISIISAQTAGRQLNITLPDANQQLTFSGTPVTLNNWFDQSVKQAATPQFADIKIDSANPLLSFYESTTYRALIQYGAAANALIFKTLNAAAVMTERIRIVGETDNLLIGIGGINPAEEVDILHTQNSDTRLRIRNLNAGANSRAGFWAGSENANLFMEAFASGVVSPYADSAMVYTSGAYPLHLGTQGVRRATFESAGNLTLYHNAYIDTPNPALTFKESTIDRSAIQYVGIHNALTISTVNAAAAMTERMRIQGEVATAEIIVQNAAKLNLIAAMPMTTSKCRAYMSADQDNVVNGAWRTIQLDTESYDPGADFNIGTYIYTCPVAGYYHIDAAIQMHDTVPGSVYYFGVANSGGIIMNKILVATTTWHHFNLSDKVYCAAGEILYMAVNHNDAGNTLDITGGFRYTYMSIHLLSSA